MLTLFMFLYFYMQQWNDGGKKETENDIFESFLFCGSSAWYGGECEIWTCGKHFAPTMRAYRVCCLAFSHGYYHLTLNTSEDLLHSCLQLGKEAQIC